MNLLRRRPSQAWLLVLSVVVLLSGLLSVPASAQDDPMADPEPQPLLVMPEPNPAIVAVWDATDGALLRGERGGMFVWGDKPLAIATEHYRESETGLREMVYYDKGRLDILHTPDAPEGSEWYVSPASLVREMLDGKVQFGADESVQRGLVTIPVIGDLNQKEAVTYATLAKLTAIEKPRPARLTADADWDLGFGNEPTSMIGTEVHALVHPGGTVEPDGMHYEIDTQIVTIGGYDEVTKRNIAGPFVDWINAQPQSGLYLLGHALSEPYWVNTMIAGTPRQVLFQAFERRVLMYTPTNEPGARVESTNVGLHYRLWRNLSQPSNPSLIPLAAAVPFGEEIVNAATANLVEPHLLAAISLAASMGDPLATLENGGHGIMGLKPETAIALGVRPDPVIALDPSIVVPSTQLDPNAVNPEITTDMAIMPNGIVMEPRWVSDVMIDPAHNAAYAARAVARWAPESLSYAGVAADYYADGQPVDPAAQDAFVQRVIDISQDLLQRFPPNITPSMGVTDGQLLGTGHAAYYSPSYDTAWWERTLLLYESWQVIMPGWQNNPDGFYCVRPGYVPGHKLRLVANGVEAICTVGDMVADPHLSAWLAHWVVEMNYPLFEYLGLDRNNTVEVYHIGAEPPPPVPEVPVVEEEQPPAEVPAPPTDVAPPEDQPTNPAPPPVETPAPAQPPAAPTVQPQPTAPPAPAQTPVPTATPVPTSPAPPTPNYPATPTAELTWVPTSTPVPATAAPLPTAVGTPIP